MSESDLLDHLAEFGIINERDEAIKRAEKAEREANAAEMTIAFLDKLHKRDEGFCAECGTIWPCSTREQIDKFDAERDSWRQTAERTESEAQQYGRRVSALERELAEAREMIRVIDGPAFGRIQHYSGTFEVDHETGTDLSLTEAIQYIMGVPLESIREARAAGEG